MYSTGYSPRTILLELDGYHPPSNISKEQLLQWLTLTTGNNYDKRYEEMAEVLYHRFCYVDTPLDQPSLPTIGERLNLTIDQIRRRVRCAMTLIQTEPRYTMISRSGLLTKGSQLYVVLFGCDDPLCIYDHP